MKTPKKKYSGKRWTGTALVVVAVAVLVCGCKQESATPVEPVPEVFVEVKGATISGSVVDSEVFITGRTVEIKDFLMSDHEVTQGEYAKYMTPAQEYDKGKGVNHPAYYVSWYDAIKYCNMRSLAEDLTPCYYKDNDKSKTNPADWGEVPTSSATWTIGWNEDADGYRLPTEAEWEYAARGGNGLTGAQTTYAGSDTEGDVAWYNDNSGYKAHEVKGKKANGLDLYDMSGNVWEWCWGAVSGSFRVQRGGAWGSHANSCSVSYRFNFSPYDRGYYDGLRVVRTVVPTQN